MKIKKIVKSIKVRFDEPVMKICSKSRLLSSLYYTFWNPGFSYEQRAYLVARQVYKQKLADPGASIALLRRNIHRLEKGLIMQPRRDTFALDYIGETVRAYQNAVSSESVNTKEMAWATDVLEEYFSVCELPDQYSQLKQDFGSAQAPSCIVGEKQIPYHRDLEKAPSVSYEDLLALSVRRRSVRWFLQKPVPRELVDKAVELAAWSPSACNRMPYQFMIYDEPDKVQEVVHLPGGLAGYGHNVQMIIAVVGEQSSYFDERDRHLIYIDGSLATMSFVYALETLGLSTCCINWPEIAARDERMRKSLNLSYDQRPVMLIAVGYPDPEGLVPRSTKKSLETLRVYNK